VPLTKLEFRILGFLMENRGKVFSRDKLLSGAWEGEAFVVDRTVDVHVRSIRRKLGKHRDYIETVRGTGYRFAEVEPA
jgi:two-component system alkaline phosphatase synthesis response regulator PhoP